MCSFAMRPFSGSITLLHGHGQGDPMFVQQQTGHEQTSTTPLYTNLRCRNGSAQHFVVGCECAGPTGGCPDRCICAGSPALRRGLRLASPVAVLCCGPPLGFGAWRSWRWPAIALIDAPWDASPWRQYFTDAWWPPPTPLRCFHLMQTRIGCVPINRDHDISAGVSLCPNMTRALII